MRNTAHSETSKAAGKIVPLREGRFLPAALSWSIPPQDFRAQLLAWYDATDRELPWRILWKARQDPFHVWLSEIMLQQTMIKVVVPIYARFLEAFPDVVSFASASEETVRSAVRGLGYYRRFRLMHTAAKILVDTARASQGHLVWPRTFAQWKHLPGVGDYTAAAVASICFNDPSGVVDGNVERVFCRLLDLREPPNSPQRKKQFKALVQDLLDPQRPGDFNQALMELGQTCCTPTSPKCEACPVSFGCLSRQRSSQHLAPGPKAAPEPIDVQMGLGIVTNDQGGIALFERPATAKFLKGTWGFWTTICDPSELENGQRVGQISHSITKHRIRADVFVLTHLPKLAGTGSIRWISAQNVEEQLVANLDRKAWHLYLKQVEA